MALQGKMERMRGMCFFLTWNRSIWDGVFHICRTCIVGHEVSEQFCFLGFTYFWWDLLAAHAAFQWLVLEWRGNPRFKAESKMMTRESLSHSFPIECLADKFEMWYIHGKMVKFEK